MNSLKPPIIFEWHTQLKSAVADLNVECHFFLEGEFNLLSIHSQSVIVHLVNIDNTFTPNQLIDLQQSYLIKGTKLIHLWEDVWFNKSNQVLGRIESILGLNKRIHGRKTIVQKIDKSIAQPFLNKNHLQGFVSSRHKFGLFEKDELVAVGTFSALRKMNYKENYKSAELIRFAVKSGYSVIGGLSKLITHFSALYNPDDIMTYADRDWSAGEVYQKLNFIQTDLLNSQFFSLDIDFNRIIIKENSLSSASVFNTGSLKYILKF